MLTRTIPSQHEQLGEHGILEFARRAAAAAAAPHPAQRAPQLHHPDFLGLRRRQVDRGGELCAAASPRRDDRGADRGRSPSSSPKAQLPDGYLNCWYIGREIENRWTNLRDNHELYCAGHMLEGAIAYFQATGRRRLLDIMLRYVDHIAATFGPGEGQKRGYCGHQEIELALVKLYHVTRRAKAPRPRRLLHRRARAPAALFRHRGRARGDDPKEFWAKTYEYNQSHKPVREQDKVVGHAVRAMYMYAAMADLAAELGDDSLKRACERAVGGRDVEAHVRDGRARPVGRQRRLHHRLRPAERHRLCGDLRLGRADLLGAAHAQPRAATAPMPT